MAQKEHVIQNLEIASRQGIDRTKTLIQKIQNQKLACEGILKKNQYLTGVFQSDVNYIEGIHLSSMTKVETQEQWEKFLKITMRLTSIISKFHESTKTGSMIDLRSEYETQKQTIEILEEEIRSLKVTLSSVTEAETGQYVFGRPVRVEPTLDLQLCHSEIFDQLQSKINFEIAAAIKKSTESIQKQASDEMEQNVFYNDNVIAEMSHQFTEIQKGLRQRISDGESKISSLEDSNAEAEMKLRNEISDKNLALIKVNDLEAKLSKLEMQLNEQKDEYKKLKTKISNQTKTNSQQQQALVSKCNEIKTLKAKTTKYEMLLSEKDAIIGEYVSVLDSKY